MEDFMGSIHVVCDFFFFFAKHSQCVELHLALDSCWVAGFRVLDLCSSFRLHIDKQTAIDVPY